MISFFPHTKHWFSWPILPLQNSWGPNIWKHTTGNFYSIGDVVPCEQHTVSLLVSPWSNVWWQVSPQASQDWELLCQIHLPLSPVLYVDLICAGGGSDCLHPVGCVWDPLAETLLFTARRALCAESTRHGWLSKGQPAASTHPHTHTWIHRRAQKSTRTCRVMWPIHGCWMFTALQSLWPAELTAVDAETNWPGRP